MVRRFCKSGEQEGLKGAVHATACVIAGVMAMYNVAAWCFRRESHLGTNALVYSLAVAWEAKQTMHHLQHLQELRELNAPPECAPERATAEVAA